MNVINISSKPGNPSTFWQGDSGRYYRTRHLAEIDDRTRSIDPEQYRIRKTIWDTSKHTIIYSLIAVAFVCLIIYGQRIGKLEIKINK